jgi:hypothetical protein
LPRFENVAVASALGLHFGVFVRVFDVSFQSALAWHQDPSKQVYNRYATLLAVDAFPAAKPSVHYINRKRKEASGRNQAETNKKIVVAQQFSGRL